VTRLSAADKQLLIDLTWEGQLPADPVEVTHFFSFPLNEKGARAANAELMDGGYETWLLTESESDDYWHIAAVKVQSLHAPAVASTTASMEALAEQHGGRYDSWDVTHSTRTRTDWGLRSRLLELRASGDR
jgi:Regulator of ribonuclease activity B